MKLVRMLLWLVVLAAGAVALLAWGARYADGPIAIFPGGPFESGEVVDDPDADLSFAADIEEIELQSGQPPTSRTVWVLVEDHEAYVPCSLNFPPGKQWHYDALEHPRAEVRIEGKRYPRRLERVEDDDLHARLMQAVSEKYGGLPNTDASEVWFFHLAPAG